MFFDFDLLCAQTDGKFSKVWIAATRGVRTLGSRDITSVNVVVVCEEIWKMITTKSAIPRQRLSLSLSARLINGTIRIHNKQVDLLYKSIIKFQTMIHFPIVAEEVELPPHSRIEEDRDPIVKEKKRRKKKIILSQNGHLVEPDVETTATEAPAERRLTFLREAEMDTSVVRSTGRLTRAEIEEYISKSTVPTEEVPIVSTVLPEEAILPLVMEPVPEIPHQTEGEYTVPAKRRRLTPPQRKATSPLTEDEEIQRILTQVELGTEAMQVEGTRELPKEAAVPEVPPKVTAAEKPGIPQITQREKVPPAAKAKNKAYLELKQKISRNINTPKSESYELFDVERCNENIEFPRILRINIMSAMKNYLGTTEAQIEQMRTQMSGSISSSGSMSLRIPSGGTPRDITTIPRVEELAVSVGQEEIPAATQLPQEVPATPEILPVEVDLPQRLTSPLAESTAYEKSKLGVSEGAVLSPIMELSQIEQTIVETLPPAARARVTSPDKIATVRFEEQEGTRAPPRKRRKLREGISDAQRDILNIMNEWDFAAKNLYIEDVCPLPINRMNISITFTNLLYLTKRRHVKLNHVPGTIELGAIELGNVISK